MKFRLALRPLEQHSYPPLRPQTPMATGKMGTHEYKLNQAHI